MHTWLLIALAVSLSHLASPECSRAQSLDPDTSVRALSAPLVHRAGGAGAAPFVRHASGDFVLAAEGVLRTDPEGRTRWYRPDPDTVDVATSDDGAVFGLARFPRERPTSARVVRFASDGTRQWTRVLHARRIDAYTYPDITAAPGGDVILCSTVRFGRTTGVVIDRLDPAGDRRWSRRVAFSGECAVVAADGAGNVYWAGSNASSGASIATLEKLDLAGNVVWSTRYSEYPLPVELAVSADGSVTLGGVFDGTCDLVPGPEAAIARADGYTAFVTRFDAHGQARWAWAGEVGGTLAALVLRGSETLVVEAGAMTRLDGAGREVGRARFGTPVRDGLVSAPFLSVTGALLDASGRVVVAGGLPEPTDMPGSDYYLWSERPYQGPRGAVLGRPGW